RGRGGVSGRRLVLQCRLDLALFLDHGGVRGPLTMEIEGPVTGVSADAERILRTLPDWFGIEASLLEYVRDTERFPTFIARAHNQTVSFLTVREHFPQSWEIHCFAVQAQSRRQGIGRALHRHVENWLAARGVRFLQVKTVAASNTSPEYAETRAFYE